MASKFILPAFLAIALSTVTSLASPFQFARELIPRDNRYNLNCSNAPNVVAGNLVNQSDVVLSTDLPPSGSTQTWMKYLWCTPGTKTYTFFDFGHMFPYPDGHFDVYNGLNIALGTAKDYLAIRGDTNFDPNGLNVGFFPNLPDTNVRFFVRDSKGKMLYSILEAALTGMLTMVSNYDKSNFPFVFQINDGDHGGEVGQGYLGLMPDGTVKSCTVDKTSDTYNGAVPCNDGGFIP